MPAAIITKWRLIVLSASRRCGRQYARMSRSGFKPRPDAFRYLPRGGRGCPALWYALPGGRSTEEVGQPIVPGGLVGGREVGVGRARVRDHEHGRVADPEALHPQLDRPVGLA